MPILGVAINRSPDELRQRIETDVAKASGMLGLDCKLAEQDIHILAGYLGEGYAAPTPGAMNAIALAARLEGILLDPCYTGKAMHAAIDVARRFGAGRNVVFIHTGGLPGIFSYPSESYLPADAAAAGDGTAAAFPAHPYLPGISARSPIP